MVFPQKRLLNLIQYLVIRTKTLLAGKVREPPIGFKDLSADFLPSSPWTQRPCVWSWSTQKHKDKKTQQLTETAWTTERRLIQPSHSSLSNTSFKSNTQGLMKRFFFFFLGKISLKPTLKAKPWGCESFERDIRSAERTSCPPLQLCAVCSSSEANRVSWCFINCRSVSGQLLLHRQDFPSWCNVHSTDIYFTHVFHLCWWITKKCYLNPSVFSHCATFFLNFWFLTLHTHWQVFLLSFLWKAYFIYFWVSLKLSLLPLLQVVLLPLD